MADAISPGVIRTETSIHIEMAGYLRGHLLPPAFFTCFPAGGGGYHRGQLLWQMGLKPGFPDFMIVWGALYCVEIKNDIGTLSDNQKECHKLLRAARAHVAVCRTLIALKAQLSIWGIPVSLIGHNTNAFQDAVDRVLAKGDAIYDSDQPLFPDDDNFDRIKLLNKANPFI